MLTTIIDNIHLQALTLTQHILKNIELSINTKIFILTESIFSNQFFHISIGILVIMSLYDEMREQQGYKKLFGIEDKINRLVNSIHTLVGKLQSYLGSNSKSSMPSKAVNSKIIKKPPAIKPTYPKAEHIPKLNQSVYYPIHLATKDIQKLKKSLEEMDISEPISWLCPIGLSILELPIKLIGTNTDGTNTDGRICANSLGPNNAINLPKCVNQQTLILKELCRTKLGNKIPTNRAKIIHASIDQEQIKQMNQAIATICRTGILPDKNKIQGLPQYQNYINYNPKNRTTAEAQKIKSAIKKHFPQLLCPLSKELPLCPTKITKEDSSYTGYCYEQEKINAFIKQYQCNPRDHNKLSMNDIAIDYERIDDIQHLLMDLENIGHITYLDNKTKQEKWLKLTDILDPPRPEPRQHRDLRQ